MMPVSTVPSSTDQPQPKTISTEKFQDTKSKAMQNKLKSVLHHVEEEENKNKSPYEEASIDYRSVLKHQKKDTVAQPTTNTEHTYTVPPAINTVYSTPYPTSVSSINTKVEVKTEATTEKKETESPTKPASKAYQPPSVTATEISYEIPEGIIDRLQQSVTQIMSLGDDDDDIIPPPPMGNPEDEDIPPPPPEEENANEKDESDEEGNNE